MENPNNLGAVEWLEERFEKFLAYYEGHHKAEMYSIHQLSNDFDQAKEIENDYKLKNQLFKGKVMDVIGWDKTLELLKECENAFK